MYNKVLTRKKRIVFNENLVSLFCQESTKLRLSNLFYCLTSLCLSWTEMCRICLSSYKFVHIERELNLTHQPMDRETVKSYFKIMTLYLIPSLNTVCFYLKVPTLVCTLLNPFVIQFTFKFYNLDHHFSLLRFLLQTHYLLFI